MSLELDGQLVAQHKIHLPGKAQIIHGVHQPQTIAVAQLRGFQAEVQIRAWLLTPHRPRAKQPDALHLRLCCEHGQEPLLRLCRDVYGASS